MSVLLTGGSGFIGVPLVKELVRRGHQVVVFDNRPNLDAFEEVLDRVRIVQGDVTIFDEVFDSMKENRVTDVFHLAAILSSACEESPSLGFKINVQGTLNVLEAARAVGVEKFIFPSSIATYGEGLTLPVNENTRQEPGSFYGATKVFCELWGLQYFRKFGLQFRSVRLPSIIGAGRADGGASVYASLMIEKPAKGEEYTVYVDEETSIPLLYIKDATMLLVSLYEASEMESRILNVGGITPTAGEIAHKVNEYVAGTKVKFEPNPAVVAMVRKWPQADSSKVKRELGWNISYDLDLLVRDFIQEVRSQGLRRQ